MPPFLSTAKGVVVICKCTHLEARTSDQPLIHSNAVGESIDPQILEMKVFSKKEDCKSVIWLVSHICISFLIHVVHDSLHIIFAGRSEIVHAIQETNESTAKMGSNQGLSKDPSKKISCGSVVQESLSPIDGWRWWNIQLSRCATKISIFIT